MLKWYMMVQLKDYSFQAIWSCKAIFKCLESCGAVGVPDVLQGFSRKPTAKPTYPKPETSRPCSVFKFPTLKLQPDTPSLKREPLVNHPSLPNSYKAPSESLASSRNPTLESQTPAVPTGSLESGISFILKQNPNCLPLSRPNLTKPHQEPRPGNLHP